MDYAGKMDYSKILGYYLQLKIDREFDNRKSS